ncbi:MAG TPA: PIN domain-containing protein [Flavobacteriales bacterium]|nr:PIN domain-containing protein [Flavobacteriales bacterium]
MGPVLIDSSVIVGVLRNHANALALAEQVKGVPKAIPDEVIGEVLAGARNKREFGFLLTHLRDNFIWMSGNEQVSTAFRNLLIRYGPHHGVHMVDYRIAATAIVHEFPLLTLNKKHVQFIEGLRLA